MPTVELTDMTVATAKPGGSDRLEFWDAAMPGFGLRVSRTGRKTWVVMYRAAGRKRRLTLGTYPALPLSAARDAARLALLDVARGGDPAAQRAANRGDGRLGFAALAEEYLERHAKRHKKSWRQDERLLAVEIVPAWGRRPAEAIGRQDVLRLVESIAARGAPIQANRVLALVRKLFNWAAETGLMGASPATNIAPPGTERPRDRALSAEEIERLWAAWTELGPPFGPLFKLLLITGQRRETVTAMRWDDITPHDGVWTIPAERSSRGRPHPVPLPPAAAEILLGLPRSAGGFVFPARAVGDRPVSGHARAHRRSGLTAGVADWRLHDLRRTVARGLDRLAVPLSVIAGLLDEPMAPVLGVAPDRESGADLETKRRAIEAWAATLPAG